MTKYALIFTAAYLVLTAAFALAAHALNLSGSSGVNIAIALAAVSIAGWYFNRDNQRLPTTEEKTKFTLLSLAGSFTSSTVLLLVFISTLPSEERNELLQAIMSSSHAVFFVGALVFLVVLYYFAIRWYFSWFTKIIHKPQAS